MTNAIKLFVAFSIIIAVAHYAFPAAQLVVKDAPAVFKFLANLGGAVEISFK